MRAGLNGAETKGAETKGDKDNYVLLIVQIHDELHRNSLLVLWEENTVEQRTKNKDQKKVQRHINDTRIPS